MLLLSVVACDKYLDKDPDSRVTVDSADKVQSSWSVPILPRPQR